MPLWNKQKTITQQGNTPWNDSFWKLARVQGCIKLNGKDSPTPWEQSLPNIGFCNLWTCQSLLIQSVYHSDTSQKVVFTGVAPSGIVGGQRVVCSRTLYLNFGAIWSRHLATFSQSRPKLKVLVHIGEICVYLCIIYPCGYYMLMHVIYVLYVCVCYTCIYVCYMFMCTLCMYCGTEITVPEAKGMVLPSSRRE